MLDIKFIRQNIQTIKEALKARNYSFDLDGLVSLDQRRREIITELDELRSRQNKINKEIALLAKEKKDFSDKTNEAKNLGREILKYEHEFKEIKEKFDNLLLRIPNIIASDIPQGTAKENKVIKTYGSPRKFNFKPRNHMELMQNLDLVDFKRAAKITGTNFALFKGKGALLSRALINFMLNLHTKKHGYREISPPYIVNSQAMLGTAQLPNLEEDMYKIEDSNFFLIPTAEVPVTNLYRDEILEEAQLPIYQTAYTACFRKEAGSYGNQTRGLIRVHQFDKVELVKFVHPQTSEEEHKKLLADAEEVLKILQIPYRVVLLASGDLSFAAYKCYDLEIYAPSTDMWLEVSSCSNFLDFQSRRANIRFKDSNKKLNFVHTLNASGVALPRLIVALAENYQNEDGTITVPEVLKDFIGEEKIGKE